jgi:hypothetical protein
MPQSLDDPRLAPLLPLLKPGKGPCPFVAGGKAAEHVTLAHYRGGRDATYVVVQRTDSDANERAVAGNLSVTIGYAPFVEGTTIIYDLTAEQMQGKARPFECDLGGRANRVYAVLPYQVERAGVMKDQARPPRNVDIAFLDARDEPLAAALLFQWRFSRGGQSLASGYAATDERGRFRLELPGAGGRCELIVRSLLTGLEERFSIG